MGRRVLFERAGKIRGHIIAVARRRTGYAREKCSLKFMVVDDPVALDCQPRPRAQEFPVSSPRYMDGSVRDVLFI